MLLIFADLAMGRIPFTTYCNLCLLAKKAIIAIYPTNPAQQEKVFVTQGSPSLVLGPWVDLSYFTTQVITRCSWLKVKGGWIFDCL